ncbi:hypothetical protein D8674_033487 [Pyrus ussuriensis x Pyrus communis]|uniref:Integrase catalytic domain-containing protein n=1 Tax=Pyrus ussuriensis x Pyrus communis TaxID=2448454 RepID=A0A5N5HRC1_9ROSA|nr:hypothetical protein D8674_033487 [Pyrus ussuriensis x Pyrus communis]
MILLYKPYRLDGYILSILVSFAFLLHRFSILLSLRFLPPPPYLLDQHGCLTGNPNPAFEAWYEKDQNILIWLNSTLSEEIIPFTVGVTSSHDLWINLENRFGGVSAAHIHQLCSRLHAIHKGDSSISEYLQRIKGISDALMAAGSPVSDQDLIAVTLNGLSDDYESFIDSIMLRISSTTLDELHGLLINKELFMNRKKKGAGPLLPTPPYSPFPQAYAAQFNALPRFQNNRGNGKGFSQRHNRGNYSWNFSQFRGNIPNSGNVSGSFRHNSGGNRSNFGGFNRNTHTNSGSYFGGKTSCQICHSLDHEAIDCYERMNYAYAGKIPLAKLAAMCVHTNSKTSPPWLIDSGATSHITNDIAALHSPVPYSGEEKVYIGDGQGMSIHHSGTSLLKTPSATFRLNNVLHVPKMKFNLFSAYQFLKDNCCALTLDSDGSTIKDRSTGRMLFQGPVHEGFYPLQAHLAHSGSNSVSFFCTDCAIGKNHKLPFSSSTSRASASLELIHCDVWGPAPVVSVSGFKYYVLFVDEFTKYTWLFPLKAKSEVYSVFVSFKAYVENLVGNRIKIFRSDSGGEFTGSVFNSFLATHDGTIDQYKARLVAKGFHQQEGVDFQETFSPVAKPVTIRILLTLAVQHNWFLNQLDISNAFLHGNLKEAVFMQQPPGFIDPSKSSFVCKLTKSLYGLKQAPRAWYDKLFHALSSLGFANSQSDSSLFVQTQPSLVIVLVWSAKKQHTVARSSTEAEYRSLAHTAAELTWICKLLQDVLFPLRQVPKLWCDNVSAISLASNPVFHARTKHVELDYHYIRELVLANLIQVLHISTHLQIADIHTKALPKARFKLLQSKLSLGDPLLSLREGKGTPHH